MHGSCRETPNSQEVDALDHFDLKLLAALEADGRLTNAELAEKVGLSASQCSRRRIRLEETGIIEGYSARLNAGRLGIGLLALDPSQPVSPFQGECQKIQRFRK